MINVPLPPEPMRFRPVPVAVTLEVPFSVIVMLDPGDSPRLNWPLPLTRILAELFSTAVPFGVLPALPLLKPLVNVPTLSSDVPFITRSEETPPVPLARASEQ